MPLFCLIFTFVLGLMVAFPPTESATIPLTPHSAKAHSTPAHPIVLRSSSDHIEIQVMEQPSTGYSWKCKFDSKVLTLLSTELTSPPLKEGSPRWFGGPRNRTMKIIGKRRHNVSLPVECGLDRHWSRSSTVSPADSLLFHVHVEKPFIQLLSRPSGSNPRRRSATSATNPKGRYRQPRNAVATSAPTSKKSGKFRTQGLPDIYDPRSDPNYPEVRNQGQCGSCWAFTTVGVLEVMYALKCGKPAPDLSEQFLVSCNTDHWSCAKGGDYAHKYHYDFVAPGERAAGAVPEGTYPYEAMDTPCSGQPLTHTLKLDSRQTYFPPTNDNIMANLVKYGAIGAGLCAEGDVGYWRPEDSPFFSGPDCKEIDHAIVIVGYNAKDRYWIIRNSWGSDWGADGYLYLGWGLSGLSETHYVEFSNCGSAGAAKCSSYGCPYGYTLKDSSATITCPSSGCTTAKCCDALCDSFTCPENTVLKGYGIRCTGGVCSSDTCCNPTCGSFTCPSGMKIIDSTKECTSGTCNQGLCCRAEYESVCNSGTVTMAGTLNDGSPSSHYDTNMDCSRLIQAPLGQTIHVVFTEFCTGTNHGFVYLYDGVDTSAPVLAELSGNCDNLPGPYDTTGNNLFVRFTTDSGNTGAGFSFDFNFVGSTCTAVAISGRSGTNDIINGVYPYAGTLHGFSYYQRSDSRSSSGRVFVYYLSEDNCWYIGPELGSTTVYAYMDSSAVEPYLELSASWTVYDGYLWVSDSLVSTASSGCPGSAPRVDPLELYPRTRLGEFSGDYGMYLLSYDPDSGTYSSLSAQEDGFHDSFEYDLYVNAKQFDWNNGQYGLSMQPGESRDAIIEFWGLPITRVFGKVHSSVSCTSGQRTWMVYVGETGRDSPIYSHTFECNETQEFSVTVPSAADGLSYGLFFAAGSASDGTTDDFLDLSLNLEIEGYPTASGVMRVGYAFDGPALDSTISADPAACCAFCQSVSGCQRWTFYADTSQCDATTNDESWTIPYTGAYSGWPASTTFCSSYVCRGNTILQSGAFFITCDSTGCTDDTCCVGAVQIGCNVEAGIDYVGNDVDSISYVDSPDACCQRCSSRTDCPVWTWNRDEHGGLCQIKSSASGRQPSSLCVSGTRKGGNSSRDSAESICGGTAIIIAAGSMDDGYPGQNYVNGMNCSRLIQAPASQTVSISFTEFCTEANYDLLRVYDGSTAKAPLLAELSGSCNSLPGPFQTSANSVYVEFTSDWAVTETGFTMSYKFAAAAKCKKPKPLPTGYAVGSAGCADGSSASKCAMKCATGYIGTVLVTCTGGVFKFQGCKPAPCATIVLLSGGMFEGLFGQYLLQSYLINDRPVYQADTKLADSWGEDLYILWSSSDEWLLTNSNDPDSFWGYSWSYDDVTNPVEAVWNDDAKFVCAGGTCASFAGCPLGSKLKSNAKKVKCTTSGSKACSAKLCCIVTNGVCGTFKCSNALTRRSDATTTLCATKKCTSKECCVGICSKYKCPARTARIAPSNVPCAAQKCTASDCCVGLCSSVKCPKNHVRVTPSTTRCAARTCTVDECCLGTCNGFKCSWPWVLVPNPKSVVCPAFDCWTLDCCV